VNTPFEQTAGRLAAPVDAAGLAAFRILFGALLVVAVVRHAAGGMIREAFVEPTFFFPLWPVPGPLPAPGMFLLFVVLGLLAVCLMVGLQARLAAGLFCLLFTYAHLSDLTHYLNHYHLVTLLTGLLAVLPAAQIWSLDALHRVRSRRACSARSFAGGAEPSEGSAYNCVRSRRACPPPAATVPAWTLWLLRFQVAVVYLFAGVAKWRSDWLVHGLPLRIWLPASGDFPLLGPLLVRPEAAYLASWAGAAFDTTVPLFLLFRRTRPFALLAAAVFHLMTARLFRLGMFPFFMIACSLLFLPAGWPRRLLPRRFRRSSPDPAAPGPHRLAPATGLALAAYALVQLLVPLRQHLHAGNVLWHERGYRFSWHVMLMEKTGDAEITIRDPGSGRPQPLRLRDHLTPLQIKTMSTQPDLLRAFARALARRAGPGAAVHADVLVSLNGRRPRRLVDPTVDLAAPSLPPGWILPGPDEPPP
jgi:vitamin K-dependent gamma-carboxylase